ncbi:hypothetical protein H6P81_008513 [Aristolochia fimbriata]|uniref:Uncharacterized protein n=1 Tax=Aristolochia fimbriata TaxID=158543 RepID=A0AAV7EMS1_ARIFI|nr:hypothetical protein H6P81_008513 [Aristolochia fimbriata]
MKLDCEPVHHHSSLDIPKVIEYENMSSGIEPSKEDNGLQNKEKSCIASILENNSKEIATEVSDTEVRHTAAKYCTDVENSIDRSSSKVAYDRIQPYPIPSREIELSEKEADLYTDKSITEIELPQMLVCFKEGNYHVVKDICVDEGVPSLDKILLESNDVGYVSFAHFLHSDVKENCDLSNAVGNSDDSQKLPETDCPFFPEAKKVASIKYPDDLLEEVDCHPDSEHEVMDDAQAGMVMAEKLAEARKSETDLGTALSQVKGNGDCQLTNQVANDQENPSTSAGMTTKEFDNGGSVIDNFFDSELDREIFTQELESSAPETSGRTVVSENTDHHPSSGQSLSYCGLEDDAVLDSLTGSTRSFFIQHGLGESSFSGARSLPNSVAHSGHIPYSGSISLRSDSSTASARSFAFPILHSEWNSSPVRMAKADRRHLRKHRGWRMSFFCCRF